MKKLVCILTVLVCLCLFAVPCFAADVTFTVKGEQPKGENVVITVTASEGSSLCTTEFYINYAESDLKIIENSIMPGADVKNLNPIVTLNKVDDGRIKISYTSTQPLEKEAVICRFECRALKNTTTPLTIEVEHAETVVDGKDIKSLTAEGGEKTRVTITQQPVELALVAIFVIIMVVGIIVVVVLIKKQKNKK